MITLPGSCASRSTDAGTNSAPDATIARVCALTVAGGDTAKAVKFIFTVRYLPVALLVLGAGTPAHLVTGIGGVVGYVRLR